MRSRRPAWHLLSPVQRQALKHDHITLGEARELLMHELMGVLVALQARVREQRKEQR